MMKLKLYRVYYEETIAYEDYVEDESEEEAKALFANTLENDDTLEPITCEVMEFEAEDVREEMHYAS